MKVRSMMAAGVAVAGVGAVALAAVTPAAPQDLVAAPTRSHEIVPTGFVNDLGDSLGLLWSGLSKSLQVEGNYLKDSSLGTTIQNGIDINPAGYLVTLPLSVAAELQAAGLAARYYQTPGLWTTNLLEVAIKLGGNGSG